MTKEISWFEKDFNDYVEGNIHLPLQSMQSKIDSYLLNFNNNDIPKELKDMGQRFMDDIRNNYIEDVKENNEDKLLEIVIDNSDTLVHRTCFRENNAVVVNVKGKGFPNTDVVEDLLKEKITKDYAKIKISNSSFTEEDKQDMIEEAITDIMEEFTDEYWDSKFWDVINMEVENLSELMEQLYSVEVFQYGRSAGYWGVKESNAIDSIECILNTEREDLLGLEILFDLIREHITELDEERCKELLDDLFDYSHDMAYEFFVDYDSVGDYLLDNTTPTSDMLNKLEEVIKDTVNHHEKDESWCEEVYAGLVMDIEWRVENMKKELSDDSSLLSYYTFYASFNTSSESLRTFKATSLEQAIKRFNNWLSTTTNAKQHENVEVIKHEDKPITLQVDKQKHLWYSEYHSS